MVVPGPVGEFVLVMVMVSAMMVVDRTVMVVNGAMMMVVMNSRHMMMVMYPRHVMMVPSVMMMLHLDHNTLV